MRLFNRVLATIISLSFIVGSAIGILYLIGLLANLPALTQLVGGIAGSLTRMSTSQIQGTLIGILFLSLVILVFEVRPWRDRFVTVRDDKQGRTQVFKSDIERYLAQRIAQKGTITPEALDIITHGNRFDVTTNVAASTTADRQAVRSQVEYDIKQNLETIGLDDDLEYISTRISRTKRVA